MSVQVNEFESANVEAKAAEAIRRTYERQLVAADKRLEELDRKCDLLTAIDAVPSAAKHSWTIAKSSRPHRAIANLLLSDLHLSEVVKPGEVGYTNAFNDRIARLRLERCAERTIIMARDLVSGFTYDGLHIWMLGDNFSGDVLHDELKETNEQPINQAVETWLDPMLTFLRTQADHFGSVTVSVRVGNHGRNTRKPRSKGRVQESYDYLFGRLLCRELRSDDRFTWDIPLAADGTWTQYGTTIMGTHGDQFHGGGGISGIATPLALGNYKKLRREMSSGKPFDLLVLGHFHQWLTLPGIIVNGSLKGQDQYAYQANMGFEVPQQAFFLVTPEHGVTLHAPIRVMDKKAEKWDQ